MNRKKKVLQMMVCTQAEKVLEDAGCEFVEPSKYTGKPYTYTFDETETELDSVNFELSREEVQNRVNTKLDEGMFRKFSACMNYGHIFPAIVLFLMGGEAVVGEGAHRYAAAREAGYTHIKGVYKFSHPDAVEISARFNSMKTNVPENMQEVLERATRTFNIKRRESEANGEPVPNQKDWARSYGVPEETFNRYMRANDIKTFLAKKNIAVDKIQHQKSFEALQRLARYDEEATTKVAQMGVDYHLGAKEIGDIVKDYIDAKSISAKVKALETADSRLKRISSNGKRKSGYTKRTPESRLKETVFKFEQQVTKIDPDKFKTLFADKELKNAVDSCKSFLIAVSR